MKSLANFQYVVNLGSHWNKKASRENIPEFVKQNGNTITGALEGFKSFFAGIGPELDGSITITPSNIKF